MRSWRSGTQDGQGVTGLLGPSAVILVWLVPPEGPPEPTQVGSECLGVSRTSASPFGFDSLTRQPRPKPRCALGVLPWALLSCS